MQPPISIITPSWNQGRFIQRTIDSVLSQNLPGLEYIVVDGGSTDDTLGVLQSYGNRLTWISEPDRGQADAVNKGIRRTSGSIVGWLNSDDIYYPDALRKVVQHFQEHPEADVIYGGADHIDADDRVIERFPTEAWCFDRLKEICFVAQPAAFVRRQVIQQVGALDTAVRYSTDYDYWLRLALAGKHFSHVLDLLAATRLHADAATIAKRVACHREIVQITRKHLGKAPDRWLLNYAHAVVNGNPKLASGRPATTFTLAAVALCAALRWNHRVTGRMLTTLSRWMIADTTRPLRRMRYP